MRPLLKFLRLPFRTKKLLVEAILRLAYTTVVLRIVPAARALQPIPSGRLKTTSNFSAQEICWAVAKAARLVPGAACLPQSLVARTMLAQAGHAAEIRIGVSRGASGVTAHAWVSMNGVTVLGGDAASFAELRQPTLR